MNDNNEHADLSVDTSADASLQAAWRRGRLLAHQATTDAASDASSPAIAANSASREASDGEAASSLLAERDGADISLPPALLDAVLASPTLSRELALLAAAHSAIAPSVDEAPVRARPLEHTRVARMRQVLALAATLLLVVSGGLWWSNREQSTTEVLRGGASIEVVGRAGDAIVWRAVDGATRYDAEVFDVNGERVQATQTSDTTWALDAQYWGNAELRWTLRAYQGSAVLADLPLAPLP